MNASPFSDTLTTLETSKENKSGIIRQAEKNIVGDTYFTSNQQALEILLFAVSYLDGECDDEETGAVISLLHMNREIAQDSGDPDIPAITRYLETHGAAQAVRNAFDYLPEDLHESAFTYACMIAMSDGTISEEEEDMLVEMTTLTEALDERIAKQIIQVSESIMTPFY